MDFAVARRNMVECQLRTNKITDARLLSAMQDLPREEFVPAAVKTLAYIDEDVQIAEGRFIMEPMVVARIVQEAKVQAADSVLVVGAGSGYLAAVAGKMAASVFALEEDADLAQQATGILTGMAMDNVVVVEGAAAAGVADQAPFNVILFDGAVDEVPAALFDQLAEGGRLVSVIQQSERIGVATYFEKRNGVVSRRAVFDANVQPLPGFQKEKAFVF